jgi:hypothetical protein
MGKITYGNVKTSPFEIPVYLDGVRVGAIRISTAANGNPYYYKPKSGKRGPYHDLMHQVKREIEGRA